MVESASAPDQMRAAEVVAALSLATDLGMGFPLEHGLHSTIVALRLAERLGVDGATARETYYGCLLCYVGCTADAEVSASLFDEGALLRYFNPVMFGSPRETIAGVFRALGGDGGVGSRTYRAVTRLPGAVRGHRRHVIALCEVAQMLTTRLGMPPAVSTVVAGITERWDGRGLPLGRRGEEIPLAGRIVMVARDATFQHLLGGPEHAAQVVRDRAGGAFDPRVAAAFTKAPAEMLTVDAPSLWEQTLAGEPHEPLVLGTVDLERAFAAIGDFTDLISPYLTGHSSGVAELATVAARHCGFADEVVLAVRRAAFVHDVGRVAIGARIWEKAAPLTPDEYERVRLHAYHTERVLSRSPFLATLGPIATNHHERLNGSGYHRGATAAALSGPARLLAAADAYHAMTSPRPYRAALPPGDAAATLQEEANAGRLDATSVSAVLAASGHRPAKLPRPAGLTEREAQVVGLLAHGRQTKQIARALGISAKTADRHIQNAYAKMGVSSRAAAALFAMQHGLAAWGELPMVDDRSRS